jgi:L-aminopeptidase/D-esterase-like protein
VLVSAARPAAQGRANPTLTAVPGIAVGHYTYTERPTGCTVVLVDGDAIGGVSQRGGAPGTRETDLLDPLNLVDKVNAVVLSEGSTKSPPIGRQPPADRSWAEHDDWRRGDQRALDEGGRQPNGVDG